MSIKSVSFDCWELDTILNEIGETKINKILLKAISKRNKIKIETFLKHDKILYKQQEDQLRQVHCRMPTQGFANYYRNLKYQPKFSHPNNKPVIQWLDKVAYETTEEALNNRLNCIEMCIYRLQYNNPISFRFVEDETNTITKSLLTKLRTEYSALRAIVNNSIRWTITLNGSDCGITHQLADMDLWIADFYKNIKKRYAIDRWRTIGCRMYTNEHQTRIFAIGLRHPKIEAVQCLIVSNIDFALPQFV